MNLIHFRGLNCYFNCVVSAAAFLGMRYEEAFASLWSETDFYYDPYNDVYSTRRMLTNLAAMGLRLESLTSATKSEMEEGLWRCPEGGLMLIGMDAYEIPWSPIYRSLHDPHYFFAQREAQGFYAAFDPTYGKEHMRIAIGEMAPYAYDIWRMREVKPMPLEIGVTQEALRVLRGHPRTLKSVLNEIRQCVGKKRANAALLAKYIDALANNRHLFARFLQNHDPEKAQEFFNQGFFSKWQTVKNGLYKAYVLEDNRSVIDEVSGLFQGLMEQEMDVARGMIPIEENA